MKAQAAIPAIGLVLGLLIIGVSGYVYYEFNGGDGNLANPVRAVREWAKSDNAKAYELGEEIWTTQLYVSCTDLTEVHDIAEDLMIVDKTVEANRLLSDARSGVTARLNRHAQSSELPAVFVQTGFWDSVIVFCPQALFDLSGYAGPPS